MYSNSAFRLLQVACLGLAACSVLCVYPCRAQDIVSPKLVAFAGAGGVTTNAHSLGGMQAGVGMEGSNPNRWFGLGIEAGYLAPFSRFKSGSELFSLNYIPSWKVDKKGRYLPFATVGYTRLFEIGHAVNFGGGLDLRLNDSHAIRFEARDYYAPDRPAQHNVGFRIGWVAYIAD
jgi:hypothetical protein